jgi:hypothetical protein
MAGISFREYTRHILRQFERPLEDTPEPGYQIFKKFDAAAVVAS